MQISKLDHRFDCFEEREKLDNYEMLDEYDFSDSIRGRFYEPKKIPCIIKITS